MIISDEKITNILTNYNKQIQEEVDNNEWFIEDKQKNKPMEIVIKSEALDMSSLQEGEGSKQYRPETFENYIGQEEAKAQIRCEIIGCKENGETFPHTFLSAPPGHGKTLLANIIAKEINKKIVKCTGGELKTEQDFIDKIVECNGGVIFIDEASRLSKKVGFFMLPVIETFEINNQRLKPFTVIFATTHMGDISKDLDALIQRCNLRLELNHYNYNELVIITKQYKEHQYQNKSVPEEIYLKIAENCKYTPRLARSLLRSYIFINNWDRILLNNKIVKDGLTQNDIKVMKYLDKFNKGLGKNTISNYIRVKPQTYEYEIEPYLVFKEFIIVDSRRKLTEKGKDFLNEIK